MGRRTPLHGARTALATRLRQLGPGFGNRPWIRKLPGRFGYWPGFDNYLDLATEPPGWIWKLGSRRWIRKPVELDLATGPPGWIWKLGIWPLGLLGSWAKAGVGGAGQEGRGKSGGAGLLYSHLKLLSHAAGGQSPRRQCWNTIEMQQPKVLEHSRNARRQCWNTVEMHADNAGIQ